MTGLFASVSGYFDSKYSGRYFAIALLELARHEPAAFARMLEYIDGHAPSSVWKDLQADFIEEALEATREYYFEVGKRKRFADLALVDEHGAPRLLIEIKEFDGKSPRNPAQLSDYGKLVERKCAFLQINRFFPEGKIANCS